MDGGDTVPIMGMRTTARMTVWWVAVFLATTGLGLTAVGVIDVVRSGDTDTSTTDWERFMRDRGTSMREACAEYDEGVKMMGRTAYEALVIGRNGGTSDVDELVEWFEFVDGGGCD